MGGHFFSEELRSPRKGNLADDVRVTNKTLKKALLESEKEKVELLRRIDVKMVKMVELLEQLVDVNKSQSNSTHQIPYYSNPTAMLQTVTSQAFLNNFCIDIFLAMICR